MTAITSICLPVKVHPEARHVIIDEDRNVIAECGPHFAGLDGTGQMLRDAETIAAELVTVINDQAYCMAALAAALGFIAAHRDECGHDIEGQEAVYAVVDRALAMARGERVGVES